MSLFIAMFTFSLAMSISPGPVNMVIISSGVSYGIRRTFSFVSGATIGFTMLLLFVGLGFYRTINLYPFILKYLGIAGSVFIIYMGYLIARSNPELNIEEQNRPTFIQGFLMQWLNPKAWLACMAGVSMFSSPISNRIFITFSLIYFVVCYLSLFAWSVLGNKVTVILKNELRIIFFNKIMGGLLIFTAAFLLYAQFKQP
ncbi:LysE family translocator [Desulfoluna spongiiphila]|uniref:Threonine/homoserine/homoserine lactone efflux protein n=1 Tax=Desulfoluna spongiiphila TaxID=419481 RepID=A0A1G5DH69_9BACT|nr:LysE family translocator [Desulfoluna spongiiphila]SCY13966.1 Threonine/homoserine/homoserine lactone efflux protein [Desulfoluna spongiiphila]VVS95138.1 amino acid exporter protein leue-type [Desulfoluna spongiiphila]